MKNGTNPPDGRISQAEMNQIYFPGDQEPYKLKRCIFLPELVMRSGVDFYARLKIERPAGGPMVSLKKEEVKRLLSASDGFCICVDKFYLSPDHTRKAQAELKLYDNHNAAEFIAHHPRDLLHSREYCTARTINLISRYENQAQLNKAQDDAY